MCDETAAERCPTFPGLVTRLHWSFEDPAGFTGTWEERLERTRRVREAIRSKVAAWYNDTFPPAENWTLISPSIPRTIGLPANGAPPGYRRRVRRTGVQAENVVIGLRTWPEGSNLPGGRTVMVVGCRFKALG